MAIFILRQLAKINHGLFRCRGRSGENLIQFHPLREKSPIAHEEAVFDEAARIVETMATTRCAVTGETGASDLKPLTIRIADPLIAMHTTTTIVAA